LPDGLSEIFLPTGLDTPGTDLTVGQISQFSKAFDQAGLNQECSKN
jgi:hypothetical protein